MPFEIATPTAPPEIIELDEPESNQESPAHEEDEEEIVQESISEHTESKLKMLSSIAEAALSKDVLKRRMEQWVEMGFDVSELDQAMSADKSQRYTIYREVEERIRRAIECERRIQMIEVRGHTVEATKMRFRIMQLTGLEDIENTLNQILQGDST